MHTLQGHSGHIKVVSSLHNYSTIHSLPQLNSLFPLLKLVNLEGLEPTITCNMAIHKTVTQLGDLISVTEQDQTLTHQ